MNHVDEPRKDESSSSTCRQRRASKLVDLLAAGARVTTPVLAGLACLLLSAAAVWAYPPEPGGDGWAWAESSEIGPPKISLPHELPNPPMTAIQAQPVGPAQDAPVRLRDAGPARSVQPLPFVRPITGPSFTPTQDPPAGPSRNELGGPSEAMPVRSVQALPFVRPIHRAGVKLAEDAPAKPSPDELIGPSETAPVRSVQALPFPRPKEDAADTALPLPEPKEDAPDKLTTVRPTRRSEARPLGRGQTRPLRSIADLPLRLNSGRPLSPAQAAAGQSVVRASPLTTIPSGPAGPHRLAPTRAAPSEPIRSARDERYTSVQASLVQPVEGEPIRSVQDTPIGPVQEPLFKRPDDALLRPSWHLSLGPSDDQLVSSFGGLASEAEPRRPLGAGAIELEIDVDGPFTAEPVVPGQGEKKDRALGSRAAAGPSTESAMGYPPIGCLTTDIRPSEQGTMPRDDAARQYRPMVEAPISSALGRGWDQRMYLWEPTSFCHRPLYFEEINLERHGFFWCDHRCGGVPAAMVQPVLSGAHFFATVPALPYKMTLDRPCECIYTLGHYRPGSCVPHRIHRVPLCPLPAAVEACVITGLVFALP